MKLLALLHRLSAKKLLPCPAAPTPMGRVVMLLQALVLHCKSTQRNTCAMQACAMALGCPEEMHCLALCYVSEQTAHTTTSPQAIQQEALDSDIHSFETPSCNDSHLHGYPLGLLQGNPCSSTSLARQTFTALLPLTALEV